MLNFALYYNKNPTLRPFDKLRAQGGFLASNEFIRDYPRIGGLTSDSEHSSAASWTFSFEGWFTIFQGDLLRIWVIPFSATLYAIH